MPNIATDYFNRKTIPHNTIGIADKGARAIQFTGMLMTLLDVHPALAAKMQKFVYIRYAAATLESAQIVWRFVDNQLTTDNRVDNGHTLVLAAYKSTYAICGLFSGGELASVAKRIGSVAGFMSSAISAAKGSYRDDEKGRAHHALIVTIASIDAFSSPVLSNWVSVPKWALGMTYGAMAANSLLHIGRCSWNIYDTTNKKEV